MIDSDFLPQQKQFFSRVKSASDNGYETLGLFAAAVVAGNQGGLRPQTLNIVSWGYIVTRLVYNYIYIRLGSREKLTPLRSLVWSLSLFISLGLFLSAGLKLKNDYSLHEYSGSSWIQPLDKLRSWNDEDLL